VINERNARIEPVKSDYVPFASQRNAQIEDGLVGTSTLEVIDKPSDATKRIGPFPISVVLFYFSR
jgi:hypothetical protein